ncbi:FUSC family protein [Luteolibacter sp. Populi]|uniref:FUSC family protein n=1 Tax=Luteolibacter sp. Populi TaxID=3230487 RepID=UPI0034651853
MRGTVAFMLPLLAALLFPGKFDPVFACLAAHSISLVDVRGAYSLRFGLHLAMSVILAGAVALGVLGAGNLAVALGGAVLVTACGGVWRHLSADYGPGLAVSSGLVYLVALAPHAGPAGEAHPALVALGGGLLAVFLQVLLWPLHPQHPLRRAVAETWIALGDLLAAMSPEQPDRADSIVAKQAEFREVLNRSQAALTAAKRPSTKLLRQLELLNLAAARLAIRLIALHAALEAAMRGEAFRRLGPAFLPAITSLENTARAVALAAVSRQASHLAAFDVRMARLQNLLEVLQSQVRIQAGDAALAAQVQDLLGQIGGQLPIVRAALDAAVGRADERSAFSLELFDLRTLTLRPLAASLNLSRSVEPALIRHTLRMVLLVVAGVLVFKLSGIPHGYWLPFTMLVVLQPDFGSTRKRAAERVLGTLAGGLLASSLLWLKPPLPLIHGAVALMVALFSYFVKRNYAVAVFFITLVVVLLVEAHQPVTLAFTAERMACTLGGGLAALAAAFAFWPVWERSRFPAIIAAALGGNRAYFEAVLDHLRDGRPSDDPLMALRKQAESANAEAFSSLRRMSAEPELQRKGLEEAAALANGNQRVTNALTVIAVHLNDMRSRHPEMVERLREICGEAFAALGDPRQAGMQEAIASLESFRLPEVEADHRDATRFREPWVFPQISRMITELSAMLLAARATRG